MSSTAEILGHDVDVSRASDDLVRFCRSYFEAKSGTDVDVLMAHFARESVTYGDATVGWVFRDWKTLYDQFAELLAAWPAEAVAYPTRIVGDGDSGVVFFTDSPEMFGREVRAIGTVNLRDGKAVRWVDHWDGRSLTVAGVEKLRVPLDQFPGDFGEEAFGEPSVLRKLAAALSAGDADRVAALLGPNVVVEDLALHTLVTGRIAAHSFLRRTTLPYGAGLTVRHTVGNAQGGAFEWASADVPRGVTAVELDRQGLATRITSTWDSSLWTEHDLTTAQRATALGAE
ncbi:hypothetical protein DFJ67_5035 [Asanoa ferruginea]|uniref:SnoaL-like protein n=1 Tax=Asanoa ferruginea TaxID=53367 RepID=A0A3D9ZQ57_9ACTN|nr:hypothetical protein [Asanoa ferruginea]REF99009.1 hypothetical protein DFJ67_5035 [Asanoa ferruginea]GIF46308.1 hypothetical protein Afe04nite_08470 [Asanoa ferruginea]